MDASNSYLNVKIRELRDSRLPEDEEAIQLCYRVIDDIVAKLKPILRYVCKRELFTYWTYCVFIGITRVQNDGEGECAKNGQYTERLFLTEDGKFFPVRGLPGFTPKADERQICEGTNCWMDMPFSEVMAKLEAILGEAEEKRRNHLEAITKRREMLQKILAVLEG